MSFSKAVCLLGVLGALSSPLAGQKPADSKPAPGVWRFAVSGDSRDCGDVVMPKIAAAIRERAKAAPADFYWHLGDYRRMYDFDCDLAKPGFDCNPLRQSPTFDCAHPPSPPDALKRYQDKEGWDDFATRQLGVFSVPVFLAVGNHEVAGCHDIGQVKTRFHDWFTQGWIRDQQAADAHRSVAGGHAGFSWTLGESYYHFIHRGVDFVTLDNSDGTFSPQQPDGTFSPQQIDWLKNVLAADAGDPAVRSIVVGMHQALPGSAARNHAMDETAQGRSSGKTVYDLLYGASRGGSPVRGKLVYVFASHSHVFACNIFDGQTEHAGKVLPGWIVGTAGAEQYITNAPIRYGYLEVAVAGDGSLQGSFRAVAPDSPPVSSDALTKFCFNRNQKAPAHGTPAPSCLSAAAPH